MKIEDENETEPEPKGGASLIIVVKRMFFAARPMFFPASICPVILGSVWGRHGAGELDAAAFALALAATVFVHAGVNVLNDVYDDISGTDVLNTGYIHPFTGGSRFIKDGKMSRGTMLRLGLILLASAGLLGIALAVLKGAEVIALGLIGIGLGVAYSAPPLHLNSRGLGEITVGLGFGVLPVVGAAWLQSGTFGLGSLLISLPPSFWVLNILLINEIPDMEADAAVGKRTFPVRWGRHGTWSLYVAGNTFALFAITMAVGLGLLPPLSIVVPSLLLMAAIYITLAVARNGASRSSLAAAIKVTLFIHLAGTLWLTFFAWL
jgi:1,4-dihydroxy-2-naphthoate octaprenyltransferase